MLWFFARSARRHPVLPVALGLVLGGSIANLVDRVRLGRVTDFLDLDAWPAFNLGHVVVVGVNPSGRSSSSTGRSRRPPVARLRFSVLRPPGQRLDPAEDRVARGGRRLWRRRGARRRRRA
jgi:hypothetical protein